MKFSSFLVAAGAAAVLVAGCSKAPSPQDSNFVVAEGKGVEVKRSELNTTVDQFLKSQGTSREDYLKDNRSQQRLAELEAVAAQQLVLEKLVLAKAANSLNLNEADIEKETDVRMAGYKEMAPSEEIFQEQLTRSGLSEEAFRADVRNQVIIAMALDQLVPAPPAPDQATVESFYKANESRFQRQQEEVRASHVLVKVPENADDATKKAAKAKIDAARKRVLAGEDFSVVAGEVSEDRGSAQVGGDLDYFRKGEMVPEFEEVAFSSQPGTVSEVFVTPFGYHFLKVTDKHAKGKVPLSEVQSLIETRLAERDRALAVRAYLDKLVEDADMKYNIDMPKPTGAPMPPMPPAAGGAQPQVPASNPEKK